MSKEPLVTRIDRWAKSGKASSITLHPRDFYVLQSANHVETMKNRYNMEIKCLGGEKGLRRWVRENIKG